MSKLKKLFEAFMLKITPSVLDKASKNSNIQFENDLLALLLTRAPSRTLIVSPNMLFEKECRVRATGPTSFEANVLNFRNSQKTYHSFIPRTPLGSGANYVSLDMIDLLTQLHATYSSSSVVLPPYTFESGVKEESAEQRRFHNRRSIQGVQALVSLGLFLVFPIYVSIPAIALQYHWCKKYMQKSKNNSHATVLMDDAVLLSYHIWATYYHNLYDPSQELLAHLAYVLANDPQCSVGALHLLTSEELEKLYKEKFQEALNLRANADLVISKNFIRAKNEELQDHQGNSLRATSLLYRLNAQDKLPLAFKIIRDTNQIEAFLAYLNEPKCYAAYEIDEEDFITQYAQQAHAFLHQQEKTPQQTSIIVPHSATGSLTDHATPSSTKVLRSVHDL